MRRWRLPLVGIALAAALVVGGAHSLQDNVLFHPDATQIKPQADYLSVNEVVTEDGEKLVAWYSPPEAGCPVFLFFHGNGSRLDRDPWRYQRIHENGAGLLALAWRGYSGSSGKPSEQGFHKDAAAAWSWLMAQGHSSQDVIIHGYSIGTGPATRLASQVEAGGLILEAPYFSVSDLVRRKASGVPLDYLLRHPFRSDRDIPEVSEPVLMVHGAADSVIPAEQSKRLFELANEPKTYKIFESSEHNTLVRDGLYEEAIWPFVEGSWVPRGSNADAPQSTCYLSNPPVSGETP